MPKCEWKWRPGSGLVALVAGAQVTLADAPEEKQTAPALSQNIQWLAKAIQSDSDFIGLAKQAASYIDNAGMKTDYIHICHARTLQPASEDDKELVILAAAHCGKARLIDNLQVTLT